MARPSLSPEQRLQLISMLAAGESEGSIQEFWKLEYGRRLASNTIGYWRNKSRPLIAARQKERIDSALDSGLALKAQRIAALKEHAEQLAALMWIPSQSGRLHNEKAWRETLADIAVEMGDRRPRDAPQEQTIKCYVGIDPDKI